MNTQKLIVSIGLSIIITIIGFILPIESLFWFCFITGIIGFGLRFLGIQIFDLLPLIIIAPLFYVILILIFGTLSFNIVTELIIFWFKLIPSVLISNVVADILFSFGIR